MTFSVTSSAFEDGAKIPTKYTGDGDNLSLPIFWAGPPARTEEFAILCDDPDAPQEKPWVHWLLYNIPPHVQALPEGVPRTEVIADLFDAVQGKNSWNQIGYGGPLPPKGHGTHHYNIHVYALAKSLRLQPGMAREEFELAIEPYILGEATLTGTYERHEQPPEADTVGRSPPAEEARE